MESNNSFSHLDNELILETILKSVPCHIYWKGKDRKYIGCNEAQARTAGFNSPSEMIGKRSEDFQRPEIAKPIIELDQHILETGEAYSREEPGYDANDRPTTFLSLKVPIRSKGEIVGLMGISFDIGQRKQAEERAAKLAKTLADFVAQLNNNLKSPIQAIKMAVDMLHRTEQLSLMGKETLDNINQALQSMLPVLEYASLYAKVESGQLEMVSDQFQLQNYLHQVIEEYYPMAFVHGTDIYLDLRESKDEMVKAAMTQFKQCLSVLIQNSIARTKEGLIRVAAVNRQNQVDITIEDNGRQYGAERIRSLFDLDAEDEAVVDDAVMLAFCRKCIHQFGGELKAENQEHGVKFTITLPVHGLAPRQASKAEALSAWVLDSVAARAKALAGLLQQPPEHSYFIENEQTLLDLAKLENEALPEVILIDESMLPVYQVALMPLLAACEKAGIMPVLLGTRHLDATHLGTHRLAYLRKPLVGSSLLSRLQTIYQKWTKRIPRVLCMEDDRLCQAAIVHCLRDIGCDVTAAYSAEEALKVVKADAEYDLILCDIGLPDINGIDAAKELRRLVPSKTKFVALTGLTKQADLDVLYDSGVFDLILEKPAGYADLQDMLVDTGILVQ